MHASIISVIPSQKGNDIHDTMNQKQKLAAVATAYGLDPEEAKLALSYAKAAKEATQAALTATPEEAKRLKNVKRLQSLTLDLYQRLKVAVLLPAVLVNEQQSDFAGQLDGTFKELRKLEKTLFGKALTPRDALITKANTGRTIWWAIRKKIELEAPASPNPSGRHSIRPAA